MASKSPNIVILPGLCGLTELCTRCEMMVYSNHKKLCEKFYNLVVKNSPSNYSAMSYEMFVGAQKAGELQDDNKDLSSLAGSFAASSSNNQSYMSNNQVEQVVNNQDNHSHNSTQRGEEEERVSVRTNSSSLGPRKVRTGKEDGWKMEMASNWWS